MKFGQSIKHRILRLLYFTIYKLLICDTLTKLLYLLNVGSLGYQIQKLILWGFGLVLLKKAME